MGHCTEQARVKHGANPLLEQINNVVKGNAASCRCIPVVKRQLTYSGELYPKYLFQLLLSKVFIRTKTNPKLVVLEIIFLSLISYLSGYSAFTICPPKVSLFYIYPKIPNYYSVHVSQIPSFRSHFNKGFKATLLPLFDQEFFWVLSLKNHVPSLIFWLFICRHELFKQDEIQDNDKSVTWGLSYLFTSGHKYWPYILRNVVNYIFCRDITDNIFFKLYFICVYILFFWFSLCEIWLLQ